MGRPLKLGVSYFGNRYPKHFQEDIKDICEHHCNFIVLTFSENDLEFYQETLREFVRISKDQGLEVHLDPWGVGGVFGGEAYSRFALVHPEALQVSVKGDQLPAACPNSPLFRDYMRRWIETAVTLGATVLFWDEPHFYLSPEGDKNWACYCSNCQRKFQEQYGRQIPPVIDGDFAQFREDSILDFLSFLFRYSRQCGAENALCLLPERSDVQGYRDWERVVALDNLSIFGTDPYWKSLGVEMESLVRPYAQRVYGLAQRYGKEGQIWIQNFRIGEGEEEDVYRAVMIAYEEGIRNIAAWSYLGSGIISYRSANPQKVWDILGRAYGELQRREA